MTKILIIYGFVIYVKLNLMENNKVGIVYANHKVSMFVLNVIKDKTREK